ncbi:MAG: M20 family metallopeptidase [Microthrixaceae bacterium]|nr:M20 family metallopeptidase [Microthrixaceae bacterium]
MDVSGAKERVRAEVGRLSDRLLDVSHRIWDSPELCYDEHHAHDLLTEALEGAGLEVRRGAFGLPTAFEASAGTEGPTIAICCEYDALPGIGHACGHNVIAAAGLGAGLAVSCLADELGGRVVVLGTPAEEGGGGKILMIERGAFDGVDAAMMVHPADADLDSFWAIAIHELRCTFHGRAAHAAAAPERGVNALDAAVLAYMGVAALRQHIAPHERVHGIFTHGGDKPNVVPELASMQWYVRSASRESLAALEPRVLAAIEAGALATGADVDFDLHDPPYSDLRDNAPLLEAYASNSATLGRVLRSKATRPEFLGSTDMGDVSHRVPAIHPMIKVAPEGVAIHSPEFAAHARGESGDRAVLDGAVAMAQTVVDLWTDPALLARVHAAFDHPERSPAGR